MEVNKKNITYNIFVYINIFIIYINKVIFISNICIYVFVLLI